MSSRCALCLIAGAMSFADHVCIFMQAISFSRLFLSSSNIIAIMYLLRNIFLNVCALYLFVDTDLYSS